MRRSEELDVARAAQAVSCPVLVIHGSLDSAVHPSEGKQIVGWAKQGTMALVEGADHVFGMRHPWPDSTHWPVHLEEAWSRQRAWMQSNLGPHSSQNLGA